MGKTIYESTLGGPRLAIAGALFVMALLTVSCAYIATTSTPEPASSGDTPDSAISDPDPDSDEASDDAVAATPVSAPRDDDQDAAVPASDSEPADPLGDAVAATPKPASKGDSDDTVSSSDPTPQPEPTAPPPDDTIKAPAPIESVQINVAESFPPQYFVEVMAGLPNACAEFYGYEESRSGNTISITVTNLVPAPSAQVACAEIFTTHRISVPLGTEFQSGQTYVVDVNGTTETFTAQ